MRITYFILFLTMILTSCQKEEFKTDGQKAAERVSSEIKARHVTTIFVYASDGSQYYQKYNGLDYKIDGQFLITEGKQFFDFNSLQRLEFKGDTLDLYFGL